MQSIYLYCRSKLSKSARTHVTGKAYLPRALPVTRGGADRVRTDDPRLAKPVLCQLSYSPVSVVGQVGFEPTTPALSRRCSNRLSY